MKTSASVLYTIAIALLAQLSPSTSTAHSAGLSEAQITVTPAEMSARVSFANSTVAAVLDHAVDATGAPTAPAARTQLEALGAGALELRIDGKKLAGRVVSVAAAGEDGVTIDLQFERPAGARIAIRAPRIAQFPRGHRRFVSVQTTAGQAQEGMLSAADQVLVFELSGAGEKSRLVTFVKDGITHIWAGFDHILFLLALLLPAVLRRENSGWKAAESPRPVFAQAAAVVTAFTVAHSLTLALAVLGPISPHPRWIEPAIAATVLLAAANNLYPVIRSGGWWIAFLLGLVHGFGFAGALTELELPAGATARALLGFNLGVELGQLAIVAVALPLAYVVRRRAFYRPLILQAGSVLVAATATIWLLQRSAT